MTLQMRKLVASSIFLIFTAFNVQAQEKKDLESGFSGRLQGGIIFLQTDSRLSADNTNRRIIDLDGPADTHNICSGIASVYLSYRFEDGTSVYAGNPLEVGEGLALEAGINRSVGDTSVDLALTYLPIKEVWKNPYRTLSDRDQTNIDVYGLRAKLQAVAGSPWEINYKIDQIDIEEDEIGDLEDDLKRSGLTHELGIKYNLPLQPGVSLRPELSYTYGDIKGDSNSYQGINLGTLFKCARPPWVFIGLVSGFHNQYQKSHPIFGKTRHETGITTFAQVMRLNLFGAERLFASAGVGYVWSDANINFFDSHNLIGLASVGINF